MQTVIKKVVQIILNEVYLRNAQKINGIISVQISSKKFKHPEDLERIVMRINEEAGHRVLQICPEYIFEEVLKNSSNPFEVTEETITALRRIRWLPSNWAFGRERVEERYIFLIEDIDKLKQLTQSTDEFFITKNKAGDYYYRGLKLQFGGNDTIHFRIFEFLYSQHDGFAKYDEINKHLQQNGERKITDLPKQKERIANGIKALIRFAELPRDVIKTIRGKGIQLHKFIK
jgi:hypothetical protein